MAFSCEDVGSSLYQNVDGLMDVHFPVDSGFTIIPGLGGGLALEDGERAPYWVSYVPNWTNLTVNSGTVSSRYMKVNKLIFYSITLKLAADTVVGTFPFCELPVPAAPPFTGDSNYYNVPIGQGWYSDAGTASYLGVVRLQDATKMRPTVFNVTGSNTAYQSLTASVPHTWAVDDLIAMSGWYQAL